jgi:D-amino-acid oxidase
MCTALELTDAGHSVTVLAAETTPHTHSDRAGAIWLPLLNSDPTQTSTSYESNLAHWSRRSFARLAQLTGSAGVRYIRNHELFRTPERPPDYLAGLLPDLEVTEDDTLPSGYCFRWSFTTLAIETPEFMRWLRWRSRELQIPVTHRTLTSLADLPARSQDVVVNCSGLGARELVPDPDVRPVKGQLLLHDPIRYDCALGAYDFGALPRVDALVLGSLFLDQFDDPEPTPSDTDRIWSEVSSWERTASGSIGFPRGALQRSRIRRVVAGLRPFRGPGVRLELDQTAGIPTIHNYGHGASGFTLAWGCAESVVNLVRAL